MDETVKINLKTLNFIKKIKIQMCCPLEKLLKFHPSRYRNLAINLNLS